MESKVIKDKPTYSVITENEVTTEKNGMRRGDAIKIVLFMIGLVIHSML